MTVDWAETALETKEPANTAVYSNSIFSATANLPNRVSEVRLAVMLQLTGFINRPGFAMEPEIEKFVNLFIPKNPLFDTTGIGRNPMGFSAMLHQTARVTWLLVTIPLRCMDSDA